jgi:hypothetical protein
MREDARGKSRADRRARHREILNKGGWVWPCEEEGERRPQSRRRWSADKSFESASAPLKFDFKEYELKLLAAFARCYCGEITLKQLPMIPAQMAELILRSGGLTECINSDEKRLKRFLKMVREQSEPKSAKT